ncbi:hypothetical protein VTO42DRAFT_2959 [Malbranchea cinnamomea]
MRNSKVHLPNGLIYSVTPIYGGVLFKGHDMGLHHHSLPPGWSIVINTEKPTDEVSSRTTSFTLPNDSSSSPSSTPCSRNPVPGNEEPPRRFVKPTLNRDSLFISSISLPSNDDYKPAASPSRQIAMMLWATLWWYFHLEEPNSQVLTRQSSLTPKFGRPKGDWRVYIRQEGIFNGRNILQKMERMGLIASEDSSVGLDGCWGNLFVSRRSFWQLDPRIFLFTLRPTINAGLYGSIQQTPPLQPMGKERYSSHAGILAESSAILSNPFHSSSYLPTYYPPPPPQYVFTDGIVHPLRPKAPHQGEVFYTRYVPSVGKTLSFRVPKLPSKKLPLLDSFLNHRRKSSSMTSLSAVETLAISSDDSRERAFESDVDVLHRWMNKPRVSSAWGLSGPLSTQERFLEQQLCDRHLFPAFGCWDNKPFGYFEIYWLKEDKLSRLLPSPADNWDRGIRALIGQDDCTGEHLTQVWLNALVHYCWLADNRTHTVLSEPRVDNTEFINYLQKAGFYQEGEFTLPHKQCALMKVRRDSWETVVI